MEGVWGAAWSDIYGTIRAEFADVPNLKEFTRLLVRLTLAVVLGGLIGWEREAAGKAAGLRTHMMVALGSALFVVVPLQAGVPLADMSRVLQGLTAGIGFLGAGAIIKQAGKNKSSERTDGEADESDIRGLTTAASIWTVAAIGVSCGLGREMTAVVATVFSLVILQLLYAFKK
ncbi:MgtC/SapB family protein [Cupriavidus plantarum]|uniref:MgtC/SapB family protein n=1 Tax=Cupriavidus plantarum TaxID=942865 RepID=UPI000EB1D63C|nr:MgtC/SapB family protein [Cupriavidus plantarum]RLK35556.1 putative Mg2+ transporter-C (MgtC) family protein [Cupriavidus plantarum]